MMKFCSDNYVLLLLSFTSFGGHFARSSLSIFGVYMIQDQVISPEGLGVLLSASYLPSTVFPLIIGYSIDISKRMNTIATALLLCTISGQLLFAIGVYKRWFYMMLIAQILFGCGASSITAIQRMLITSNLKVSTHIFS